MRPWWLLILLVGCMTPATYEAQEEALDAFAKKNKMGNSRDFYLAKRSALGASWQNVALVYGFWDDLEGCQGLAAAYMAKFPADEYVCVPAN